MKCIINDYLVSISLCSDHEGNGFTHDSVDDTRSQLAARREDCDPSTPRDHSPVPRSVYQKKVQTLLLTKVEGMLVSPTTMTRGLLTGGRLGGAQPMIHASTERRQIFLLVDYRMT